MLPPDGREEITTRLHQTLDAISVKAIQKFWRQQPFSLEA